MDRNLSKPVIVSYVLMIVMNVVANIVPLNGMTTGAVSLKYDTLITPAGYTFMIWFVIYVMLAFYCHYQYRFYTRYRNSTDRVMKRVNQYFIVANLINIGWVVLWHYNLMFGSLIAMLLLLILLIRIRLIIGRRSHLNHQERLYLRTPFSIYFGWITVASVANVAVWIKSIHWKPENISVSWIASVLLIITGLTVILVMVRFKDTTYGLVILWALTGILIRHIIQFNGIYAYIIITLAIVECIVLFLVVKTFLGQKNKRRSHSRH